MAAKKKGLGRGLDALLPEADELLPNVVQEIPLGDIDPNTDQPRRSFPEEAMAQLAASVKEQGVLQPLLVVEQPGGRYRIVAGERRWRAARQAGLSTVPCIVRDMDMIRQMEVSLIENLQREDLNPMEEAAAIRALMQQCGYTQEAVATRLSKSRPAIANLLRLLTLPKEVAQMVRDGLLSAGHARVLAGLDREEDKLAAAGAAGRRAAPRGGSRPAGQAGENRQAPAPGAEGAGGARPGDPGHAGHPYRQRQKRKNHPAILFAGRAGAPLRGVGKAGYFMSGLHGNGRPSGTG